jgi:16S rRNA (adenine1518-N6/adenine1519-N6)-dimethyltransferase
MCGTDNMDTQNIKAKKSLGQNFLKSEKALRQLIECSHISTDGVVFEIGPGTGALTRRILETGVTVYAIEKDDRLIEVLNTEFASYIQNGKFILIHADVVDFDFKKYIDQNINPPTPKKETQATARQVKLIANIPYYITGLIIRKCVDENIFDSMTLLVQKEVAERMVCRDGKQSLLSLSVATYGRVKYVDKVLAGSFVPAPNVDSAIVYIEKYNSEIENDKDFMLSDQQKIKYFELIHAGLAHKRKTLMHNLKDYYNKEKLLELDFDKVFESVNLEKKVRGEDVDMSIYIKLLGKISSFTKVS